MKEQQAHVGDWIRFQHGGVLVIGLVEYVRKATWGGHAEYVTAQGITHDDAVVEVRPFIVRESEPK